MQDTIRTRYYRNRNKKILELADKGWAHKSIAKMMKIKNHHTVTMVIWRARHKNHNEEVRE